MFCRIYVNGKDEVSIVRLLSEILDQPITDFGYAETESYNISIRTNKEHNGKLAFQFLDGFLYFYISVELEFYNDEAFELMVNLTNKILQHLWNAGYSAVASCDYENALLENGGYRSQDVPWPKQ